MRFDIISIFPKIFSSYFSESILRRAQEEQLIKINIHNLRDFTDDKRRTVDGTPYGGGAGMVFTAEPILRAVDKIQNDKRWKTLPRKAKLILLSAKGKQFNQKIAHNWAKNYSRLIFVSGRYEGIDERVRLILRAEEISIGPYVLTDGDVAAMVLISAVSRLIPGAINLKSLKEESHWNLLLKKEVAVKSKGLEYPHYTRPEILSWKDRKYRVPKVLLSGDHKKIQEWRRGKKSSSGV